MSRLQSACAGVVVLVAASAPAPIDAQTALSEEGITLPDGSVLTTADPCPSLDPTDEMIWVGGVCIDKYEASIWDAPVGGTQITGAIPCAANGQDCINIYARSVAGVLPRGDITWFQAQRALANSGKRLPTNAEWQMAVRGTPDNNFCNVSTGSDANTGAFGQCVSAWGAFDMVGNVWEWVADWAPVSTTCTGWGTFSDDAMCFSGASTTAEGPGALIRGGSRISGTGAGPFAVNGFILSSDSDGSVGFRGARQAGRTLPSQLATAGQH